MSAMSVVATVAAAVLQTVISLHLIPH